MLDEPAWHFGPFRLEPGNARLWWGTEPIHVRPKSFAVLHYLLTHAGRLVPKDDLMQAVWPDVVVSEAMLTICLGELRRALGETRQAPRFIETVARRGYRFIGAVTRAGSGGSLPSHASEAPGLLVGREAVVEQVQAWWARAQQGERQVGFVTGEAGIGKTTLVDAWCAAVAPAAGPLRVARGQCLDQHGAGEAYLPVLEAVGQLCRGPGGPELVAQLAQYAPTWLLQLPTVLRSADLEGLHRRVLGATPERMLREFAEVVEVLTAVQPLVLVVEDLHWSDTATVDLLAYLARRREPTRLLVLGTYRPAEVLARRHPLYAIKQELTMHGLCQEVALAWLTEAEVGQYLAARFAGCAVPVELVRLVAQRTDGNPLFLTTMVDYLVRQGWVEAGTDWVTVPVGVETLATAVPDSLRQLIEQQLAQCSPAAQRVLEAASVTGVEWTVAAVAAGCGDEVLAVEEQCGVLARRGQFVQPSGVAEWPDGTVTGRYHFHHALYQQVLYDRVPTGRRVQLHRQIGGREEAGYGAHAGERAAVLAMHFDRGRDYPRAVRYLQQAAENALRRHAAREAIAHLTVALDLVPSLPNTAERAQGELALQLALGPALMVTQGYAAPAVAQTYARARALCQAMEQTVELLPALRGLWLFYLARAELPTVRALADQLVRLAQGQPDPLPLVEAHNALGATCFCLGEGPAARRHLEQSIALATGQQHRASVLRYGQDLGIRGLSYLALTLWLLGYADQALQRSQEALTLAQERAHPFTLASALYFAAKLHQFRREIALTQERAEAVSALATAHGFRQRLAVGTIQCGWALAVQGQGEAGLVHIRQGLEAHRDTGTDLGQPYRLALLAEAAGYAGQADEGLRVLAEALALVEHTGERQWEAELYRLKGVLLLSPTAKVGFPPTPTAEAATCLQRAVDIARRQHAKALELRAATSLARLWQQQGQHAAARALLAPLYGWFTEGFETADLQEASALLQELGAAARRARPHSPVVADVTEWHKYVSLSPCTFPMLWFKSCSTAAPYRPLLLLRMRRYIP